MGPSGGPPVLWETAVIDKSGVEIAAHYSSKEEAELGHEKVVFMVRSRL
jgi:hypothetical protein